MLSTRPPNQTAFRREVFVALVVGLLSLGMHCGDGPCPETPARERAELVNAHAVGAQYTLWDLYPDPRWPRRGVASATLTVSSDRRGVLALIDTGTALDSASADPNAVLRRVGAPPANGVLALLEAGPTIPPRPTQFVVPPVDDEGQPRFNALLFVPLEPSESPYSLSIAIDEELTEATVTRGSYGTCFPAEPPNLPQTLLSHAAPSDAGTD